MGGFANYSKKQDLNSLEIYILSLNDALLILSYNIFAISLPNENKLEETYWRLFDNDYDLNRWDIWRQDDKIQTHKKKNIQAKPKNLRGEVIVHKSLSFLKKVPSLT